VAEAALRLVGPDGGDAPPGGAGEALTRGPALLLGYWGDPDLTAAVRTPDGWYRTGDLGQLDKNARLTNTGREDDLVKVDGKRVALGEVEGCLEAFPKIKAAQARVITDDLGGPMVVARVVRASMCRAEDIIDHCARNLAPYKVPRQIEFCESF
jgi:long-chain acyl-CoA synthetase